MSVDQGVVAPSSTVTDSVADLARRGDETVDALEAAAADLEAARDRVAAVGRTELDRLADAHERAERCLNRYGDDATGTGDFEAYVALQDEFATLVDGLPADCRHRDAFEAALDVLDRRRLRETDLNQVRDELAPVADCVARRTELADAREAFTAARREATAVRTDLDAAIEHFQALTELESIDLDAPVDELRNPVSDYDDRVAEAVRNHLREAPARAVCDLFATAADRPLLEVRAPPADLQAYLDEDVAGSEPITTILELADQSRAKRSHSVDDPGAFATAVEPARPYLERLDAEPFTIGWPPPPGDRLRWWCREAIPVVGRFADPDCVRQLRSIRDRTRDPTFDRLRAVAVAREELDATDRERVAAGVEDELESLRSTRDRVVSALDAHPPLES